MCHDGTSIKISSPRHIFISSACQIRDTLRSNSARNNEEFAIKMFNASKDPKMTSHKLAMVEVHLYEGSKIIWDTQIVEVKPLNIVEPNKIHFVNQTTIERLKEEYPKVFEARVHHGNNNFLQVAQIFHKKISWKIMPTNIPRTNSGIDYNIGYVP